MDAVTGSPLKQRKPRILAHPHIGENETYTSPHHLPKHFSIDDVRADERNFIPADPPGKYEIA